MLHWSGLAGSACVVFCLGGLAVDCDVQIRWGLGGKGNQQSELVLE